MSRILVALGATGLFGLLGVAACADYLAVDGEGHTTATAPQSLAPVKGDICGASGLQYLVGRPRTEAPGPVDPSKRRVFCSSCMVTQDYRTDRLNIVFDKDTDLITAVKCG
jgi:hypothetical protein